MVVLVDEQPGSRLVPDETAVGSPALEKWSVGVGQSYTAELEAELSRMAPEMAQHLEFLVQLAFAASHAWVCWSQVTQTSHQ